MVGIYLKTTIFYKMTQLNFLYQFSLPLTIVVILLNNLHNQFNAENTLVDIIEREFL